MGAVGLRVVLVTAVLILIGYWTYTPTPGGYSTSSSIKLQLMLASIKVMFKVSNMLVFIGEKTGLADHRTTMKWLSNKVSRGRVNLTSIATEDTVFDGVTVRVYKPATRTTDDALPGFVYYHGGGWTHGDINQFESISAKLCRDTNSVVVSVEYRLTPEHPFPAAFDDCSAATKYFLSNANKFNVDPNRVAVGGDSAGGNLAAAVTLRLRDDKFTPKIKLQVLMYPVLQGVNLQLPSYRKTRVLITITEGASFINMYMDGTTTHVTAIANNSHVSASAKKSLAKKYFNLDKLPKKYLEGYVEPSLDYGDEEVWEKMKDFLMNPYYAPLFAENLAGLPTAYVFTAEHDSLRDEAFLYVERLREAGVKVTHAHSDIGIHGLMSFFPFIPEFVVDFDRMTQFIVTTL